MTVDPLTELIGAVVEVLTDAGVRYAITGSVASSIHGEPITSTGVDLVVQMSPYQAEQVARALPQRFYRSTEALVEAARSHGFANLIDTATPLKVDLSVLEASRFHEEILARARPVSFGGGSAGYVVVSPEDVILMKLRWRKDTRSAKQWDNALSVVRTQGARLDWKYLFDQAEKLGLTDDLTTLRDEGGV